MAGRCSACAAEGAEMDHPLLRRNVPTLTRPLCPEHHKKWTQVQRELGLLGEGAAQAKASPPANVIEAAASIVPLLAARLVQMVDELDSYAVVLAALGDQGRDAWAGLDRNHPEALADLEPWAAPDFGRRASQ